MKICTKCDISKELENFPKHKHCKDGISTWCRQCLRNNTDLWEHKNPQRKAYVSKLWQQRNPRSRANSKFKSRYGITIEIYEDMVKNQNGKCAICNKDSFNNIKGKLFVDHCHKTKIVRELLCHDCNDGLGRFKDNKNLLYKAAKYLNKHGTE